MGDEINVLFLGYVLFLNQQALHASNQHKRFQICQTASAFCVFRSLLIVLIRKRLFPLINYIWSGTSEPRISHHKGAVAKNSKDRQASKKQVTDKLFGNCEKFTACCYVVLIVLPCLEICVRRILFLQRCQEMEMKDSIAVNSKATDIIKK